MKAPINSRMTATAKLFAVGQARSGVHLPDEMVRQLVESAANQLELIVELLRMKRYGARLAQV